MALSITQKTQITLKLQLLNLTLSTSVHHHHHQKHASFIIVDTESIPMKPQLVLSTL
jgi:hypothetical protein